MHRRVLIQITMPAVVIGLVLFATCLVSGWYIHTLQTDLTRVLSHNVASLEAAQELEIRVRQLRYHTFLFLADPTPQRNAAAVVAAGSGTRSALERTTATTDPSRRIDEDHANFDHALRVARAAADTPQKQQCVREIEDGFGRYQHELRDLQDQVERKGPLTDFSHVIQVHPIQNVLDPCERLLGMNKMAMEETSRESERVSRQANLALLLIGIGGPLGGLIMGYGVARGLSRSIYRLSIRVHDVAQRLDQEVGSVSVAADGDVGNLDRQLQQVVERVEDVAERLQQHQREMLRTEQLSAVGQLAAGVAHEVRNPLTSIKMLVEAALRPRNRKPLTEDDLRVIHTEVARLEQTVQNFLDLARPPAPYPSPCDLRDILKQAIELVRTRARQQGVTLDVEEPSESVPARVDRGQLCSVLVNLFINALDAMPKGGRLRVVLEAAAATGIRLEVQDSGPGIPAEMAGRLFTPFASSKPTGTGLGLSISRRILAEHGGHITGANRPDGGAAFTITLPSPVSEELHADSVGH